MGTILAILFLITIFSILISKIVEKFQGQEGLGFLGFIKDTMPPAYWVGEFCWENKKFSLQIIGWPLVFYWGGQTTFVVLFSLWILAFAGWNLYQRLLYVPSKGELKSEDGAKHERRRKKLGLSRKEYIRERSEDFWDKKYVSPF